MQHIFECPLNSLDSPTVICTRKGSINLAIRIRISDLGDNAVRPTDGHKRTKNDRKNI